MKAALAQFIFESNTFAPGLAEIDLFKKGGVFLADEAQVCAWAAGTDSQMHGSLAVLAAAGWETAPCFTALCGSPAGRLSAACFREISSTLLDRVAAAMPFDVLILHLHGAAAADGEDDPEGYLLEKVRTDLGYRGRVVLSLDLHANFTRRMLRYADAVTAYRTFPHIDFTATGERAAYLALHRGPFTRAAAKVSALMPPTDSTHFAGHLCDLLTCARELERRHEDILDVCILPVQPWMDIDEMGSSVVVTATGGGVPLDELQKLADEWYAQRHHWKSQFTPWPEILQRLRRKGPEPWVLADTADATSGGLPRPQHRGPAATAAAPRRAARQGAALGGRSKHRRRGPRRGDPLHHRRPAGLLGRARDLDGRGQLQGPRWSLHGPSPLDGRSCGHRVGADPTRGLLVPGTDSGSGLLRVRRATAGRRPRSHGQKHDRVDGGLRRPLGARPVVRRPRGLHPRLRLHPVHRKRPRTLARRSEPGESGSDLGSGRRRLIRVPSQCL